MKKFLASAALALAAITAPATAATVFDPAVQGPFATNFQYGFNDGSGFTAFTSFSASCPRIASTSCYLRAPGNGGDFLGTYFVETDTSTQGAFLYAGDVTVHPGPGANELAVVRFVAPNAGSYRFDGFFRGVDAANSGNGVAVATPDGPGTVFNNGVNSAFGFTRTLAAGDFADFSVGNNGGYGNDTTGLNLQIAAIPEPATWAMMILGFGFVGGAMRNRTRIQARVSFG